VRDRKERMCAMLALMYTIVAESPGSIEAVLAVPVADIGIRETRFTESAFFSIAQTRPHISGSVGRIRLVSSSNQYVGILIASRPASRGCLRTPPIFPGIVAEAEPVVASPPIAVALKTKAKMPIFADRANVMKRILNVRSIAA